MRPIIFACLLALTGCQGPGKPGKTEEPAVYLGIKETLATGDTTMGRLTGFKKNDPRDVLCQHWEHKKVVGRVTYDFFKDGSVLENPRSNMRIGQWRLSGTDTLLLSFTDNTQKKYVIGNREARELQLVSKDDGGQNVILNFKSDALFHKNMHNDPFHPVNNQWRIKPDKPESDSAIQLRVKGCIRFYALYYRDVFKRNKSAIDFEGLPTVFKWYSGGIGIVDRSEMQDGWIECFYDRKDALKGYQVVHNLIVNFEYDWPDAPAWSYQTLSVLEQMYHKMD